MLCLCKGSKLSLMGDSPISEVLTAELLKHLQPSIRRQAQPFDVLGTRAHHPGAAVLIHDQVAPLHGCTCRPMPANLVWLCCVVPQSPIVLPDAAANLQHVPVQGVCSSTGPQAI